MKSSTSIATQQALRIAKRLAKHWQHKFPVSSTATTFEIEMPTAKVLMSPLAEQLNVEISTHDEQVDLVHLQKVVLDHLERMGSEPLTAEWH